MPLEFELCPGRVVGGDHPCFIIAEIGQNHQGDIEIAKKMIKMAKVTDLVQSDRGSLQSQIAFSFVLYSRLALHFVSA